MMPVTGRKISIERTVRGNKREASKALAAMVAEVDRRPSRLPGRERSRTSAGSGSTTLLRASRPRPSRPRGCTSRTRSSPPSGPLPVTKLTPADLDRFYRQLLEVGRSRGPYAPATIRRVHGIIRRALTQGVRWGWITHNPAIDASPPRVPMKELKPPDPDQVVRLFRLAQESDPELATFIMLAASSGARRGELLALRWSDIDLDRGRLSIERGIVRVGDTSSNRARRRIRVGGSLSMPGRSLR